MKKIITVFFLLSNLMIGQIVNSDFENGINNWLDDTNLSLTEESIIVHVGSKSLNCTFDSPTQANCDLRSELIIGITGSTAYTVSAWFYDNDPAGRANLVFEWYDSGDNYISASYFGTYTSDQVTWQKLEYTTNSPANAASCKVGSRFYDVSANWDGNCTIYVDNFEGAPAPLPVDLTTFSASLVNQDVCLNWETATEVNNYGFDLERKFVTQIENNITDEWEKIGFISGHGNSNSPKYYSFNDKKVTVSGTYIYRLKQLDIDGTYEYSDAVEVKIAAPNNLELCQNYPNPFNPITSIKFNLPTDSQVKLNVYNVLGQEVAELLNNNIAAGYHSIEFNATNFNSGIYFYKLETSNIVQIRKMMLVK